MGSGSSKDGSEGEPLETINKHSSCINCMALSEDSSLLVTGSDDATATMWSTQTGPIQDLGTLSGHESFIQCATVYDTYVITGSKDNTIRRWEMAKEECEFVYEGHTGRVNRLICTGDFIFSTSHDKTARAWLFHTDDVDKPEQALLRTFQGHKGLVSPIVFVPGQPTGLPDEEGHNINPTDLVITGSFDSTARAWSLDTGKCLRVFKGHQQSISCMDTDPMGAILYTAGQDKAIIAWNISRGSIMKKVENAHSGPILSLRVVSRLAYTTSTDHTAKCWVREGLENTRVYKDHTDSVPSAKFHNGMLYTICNDGIVRAFDAKSGALKRRFKGHESAVTCLALCVTEHQGEVYTRLFTGGNDGAIKVWNATGLSGELPEVPLPTHEFDEEQYERLNELDRRLDEYMPASPLPDDTALPAPDQPQHQQ